MQSNCRKEKMDELENKTTGVRAHIAELTTKVVSEPAILHPELRKKEDSTILQAKTVAQHRATVLSLIANIESLSFENRYCSDTSVTHRRRD